MFKHYPWLLRVYFLKSSLIQDCFWSPQFVKFIARVNWKGFFRPCKCDLIVNSNFKLVVKDSLAQTVLVYVHLTANMASVDTRTDRVLSVLKNGWVAIVQQVNLHKSIFLISHLAQLGRNSLINHFLKIIIKRVCSKLS